MLRMRTSQSPAEVFPLLLLAPPEAVASSLRLKPPRRPKPRLTASDLRILATIRSDIPTGQLVLRLFLELVPVVAPYDPPGRITRRLGIVLTSVNDNTPILAQPCFSLSPCFVLQTGYL